MITGKAIGLKKGDFVFTGAFPGIVISDVHTSTPCCEVWGFEHESGSAYAKDMSKITYGTFLAMCADHGHNAPLEAYSTVAKAAIRNAAAQAVPDLTQKGD